jgi:hypothetical protein
MALNFLLKRSGTASKRPTAASMALGELDLNYDASTGGVYYKDSAGNVVKVGPCQVSATAPNVAPAGSAGNSTGEFWFDTSNTVLKVWNGSSWVNTVSTSGFLPLAGGTMTGNIAFNGGQTFPISGIQSASTTQPGVVQLNDTTSSTSTTEALTANQGKELQDQINALSVSSNIILAGTIDASTGDLTTVTAEGTAAGFTVGDPLPSAASGNDNFFVIVTTPGTMTPPGGSAQECHQGDWWLSDGTAWVFLDVGFNATAATTTTPGVVQLATDAEVQAGSNTDHAVTSSGLQSKLSDSTSTVSSATIASSTAVKDAYDAGVQGQTDAAAAQATADAALPKSGGTMTGDIIFNAGQTFSGTVGAQDFQAKGDLVAGYGANLFGILSVGTNGQVLSANSSCVSGLEWIAAGGGGSGTVTSIIAGTGLTGGTITDSGTIALDSACVIAPTALTAKGSLISASAASTPAALAVGTNGQILYANSACSTGLCWGALPSYGAFTPTTLGLGYGRTGQSGGNVASGYGALALINSFLPGFGNTAVGNDALCGVDSGSYNTVVGAQSGMLITGDNNLVFGSAAGTLLTTGNANVLIGNGTEVASPTGDNQLAIGWSIGCNWLTGDSTKAIKPAAGILDCANSTGSAGQVLMSNGANALCWGTAGGGGGSPATPTVAGIVLGCTNATSTALGCNALLATTTGIFNVGVGICAGRCYTSNAGVFVGARAGYSATTAIGNVAIGADSGGATGTLATGCNTTVGYRSGCRLGAGDSNTLIGWQAGLNITSGCFNTAVGHQALVTLTNFGSCSTALGHLSSCSSTGTGVTSVGAFTGGALGNSGNFNTLLGFSSGCALSTGHANVIIGSAANNVGTISPVFNVTTESNRFVAGSTAVTNAYVQVAWTVVSDARDKIVQGDVPHGLDFVNQLEPKAFHFKEERDSDVPHGPLRYGFLAQDVLALEGGDGIIIDAEDPDKLRYNGEALVPVLVNAVKELTAMNAALEARIAALENQ